MIKTFKSTIILVFITFIFTSCSSVIYKVDDIINKSDGTDFTKLSNKLSINICSSLESYNQMEDIYITDFVNISSLKNRSQLGFLLSSDLKVATVSNCSNNLNIKELALGQSIKIGSQGVKILSRDISNLKIKTVSTDGKVIVGTYTITSKKLIIYIKVLDLKDGTIYYSQSTSTNITDEILELEGISRKDQKTTSDAYQPLVL